MRIMGVPLKICGHIRGHRANQRHAMRARRTREFGACEGVTAISFAASNVWAMLRAPGDRDQLFRLIATRRSD